MSDGPDRIYGEFAPSTLGSRPIDQFGTTLECMDGRPQRKVADYLSTSFGVRNLDNITTAGMVCHVAGDTDQTGAILDNLDISIEQHGLRKVAVGPTTTVRGTRCPTRR